MTYVSTLRLKQWHGTFFEEVSCLFGKAELSRSFAVHWSLLGYRGLHLRFGDDFERLIDATVAAAVAQRSQPKRCRCTLFGQRSFGFDFLAGLTVQGGRQGEPFTFADGGPMQSAGAFLPFAHFDFGGTGRAAGPCSPHWRRIRGCHKRNETVSCRWQQNYGFRENSDNMNMRREVWTSNSHLCLNH